MLRIQLFSIFTINSPRVLAAIARLGLLMVKTLTNVLFNYYIHCYILILNAYDNGLYTSMTG